MSRTNAPRLGLLAAAVALVYAGLAGDSDTLWGLALLCVAAALAMYAGGPLPDVLRSPRLTRAGLTVMTATVLTSAVGMLSGDPQRWAPWASAGRLLSLGGLRRPSRPARNQR